VKWVEAFMRDAEMRRDNLHNRLERLLGVDVSSKLWAAVKRLATPCLYVKTSKGLVVRKECLKAVLKQLQDDE